MKTGYNDEKGSERRSLEQNLGLIVNQNKVRLHIASVQVHNMIASHVSQSTRTLLQSNSRVVPHLVG